MYISLVIGPFCCKPISMRAMVLEYRDWLPILLSVNYAFTAIYSRQEMKAFPVKDSILRAK